MDPNGKNLKQISDLDTDKSSIVWAPDSKSLIFASSDKKLYLFSVADGKTRVLTSSTLAQPWGPAFSPDSKWVSFLKQDETLRNHVYILALKGGPERRITDDDRSFSEGNAVWSGDGRFLAYTIQAGTGGGVASTGGRAANETKLMALPLRATQTRIPSIRTLTARPTLYAPTPPPAARAVALAGLAVARWRRPRRGFRACGGQNRLEGPDQAGSADRGCGRHDRGLEGRAHRQRHRLHGGLGHVYRESGGKRRDCPRTLRPVEHLRQPWPGSRRLSQRQRHGLYQGRPLPLFPLWRRHLRGIRGRRWPGGHRARGFRSTRGRGRRGFAPAPAEPAASSAGPTARQVTFTIHTELDHHALRKEVFLEGWRVMKNRFYDAKMHGADWNAAKNTYGAVLDNLVDQEELHNVLMMMIGELNASHTGVSGGPSGVDPSVATTRYPGFELVAESRRASTAWAISGKAVPPTRNT